MIKNSINNNIFDTDCKHIAFAVNTEGYNDAGFAGMVSEKYWPELAICGKHEIGDVLTKQCGDKTFHALVCHSLKEGWGEDQASVIKECFDNIDSNGEPIASVAIGQGLIGVLSGSDFIQILCGMHDSKNDVVLYSRYTLEAVMDAINKNKGQTLSHKKNN